MDEPLTKPPAVEEGDDSVAQEYDPVEVLEDELTDARELDGDEDAEDDDDDA